MDFQLLKRQILLYLLTNKVLLDTELSSVKGQYVPVSYDEAAIEAALLRWHANEYVGSPWQLLLGSVINPDNYLAVFLELMQEPGHPSTTWFQQAFVDSMQRQLYGKWFEDSKQWHRILKPVEASAVLQHFINLLDQLKSNHFASPKYQTGQEIVALLDLIKELADKLRKRLDTWAQELIVKCNTVLKEMLDYKQQWQAAWKQQANTTQGSSHYLGQVRGDDDLQQIDRWAREALQTWLSLKTVTDEEVIFATIRERVLFSPRFDGALLRLQLNVYVAQKESFANAEQAFSVLKKHADNIAQKIEVLRIEGGLATLPEPDDIAKQAQKLVSSTVSQQSVLVMPTLLTLMEQQRYQAPLTTFREKLPVPAGHAEVDFCTGDDHAAIRRLDCRHETVLLPTLLPAESQIPYVQMAEKLAETAFIK